MVGSSKHGDLVRLLAGARSAAKQIEYMKEYGTSHPPEYLPKSSTNEKSTENVEKAVVANDNKEEGGEVQETCVQETDITASNKEIH